MATFYNSKDKYFISTNTKVMFSNLESQENLANAEGSKEFSNNLIKRFSSKALPHYFLVRNPFTRLESFFRDKLRKGPTEEMSYRGRIRNSQIVFFPLLGIDKDNDELETIRQKLLAVTFEDFIGYLPKVHEKDHHLRPQYQVLHRRIGKVIPFQIKVDKVMKMEESSTMDFLSDELNLTVRRKKNVNVTSGKYGEPLEWKSEMVDIVTNLYKLDFEYFGYSKEHK